MIAHLRFTHQHERIEIIHLGIIARCGTLRFTFVLDNPRRMYRNQGVVLDKTAIGGHRDRFIDERGGVLDGPTEPPMRKQDKRGPVRNGRVVR